MVLDKQKTLSKNAAKVFFTLSKGDTPILDIELRYKGDFSAFPQFFAGITPEFKEMIKKIGDTMKYQESKQLAEAVQHSLYTNLSKINTKASNHGIKPGPFVVLLGLDVPSILTEVTSLSDKLEEQRLNTTEYRDKIAKYLEKGIVSYLNEGTDTKDSLQNTNTILSKNTILSGGGVNAEKEEDRDQEKTRR